MRHFVEAARRLVWGAVVLGSVVLSSWGGLAVADEVRVVEEKGGFSYAVPKTWEVDPVEGQKYQLAFAPVTPGKRFRSNMNMQTETFAGTLEAYTVSAIVGLKRTYPNARKLDQGEFTTKGGEKGMKLAFDNAVNMVEYRQHFYLFKRGDTAYVFTATALGEEAGKFGPVFDKIGRSFRFEKSETPEPK